MKYELYESKGKYYFRLKARNGQVILKSQGYASKSGCMAGIKSVQENAKNLDQFEFKVSKDERYYFNLFAKNKQVIGTSQMYRTKTTCHNGIAAVQRVAGSAPIKEL